MSKHILLCDDEPSIIRAAEIKLSRAGYRVTCCGDGVAALEAIEREKPDLLITDCQMPRMGGLDLIRNLREREATHDLPIYMITAKGFELSVDSLRQQWNVLGLIPKPFSPREMLKLIDELFAVGAV